MALSYYSNWDTFQHELIEEEEEEEEEEAKLPPELYNDNFTLDSYFNIAQFLELEPGPDNIFSSENYTNPLPHDYLSTPPNNNNLNHFLSPPDLTFQVNNPQEFNFEQTFHTPKRQKLIHDFDYEQLVYSDNQVVNHGLTTNQQLQSGCYMPDVTILPTLPVFSTVNKQQQQQQKQPISLSAQSIAARQRRRKISEKTQGLGKLIPGAHNLNTAQMFQAAYKYIKFLQAQLGILQSMPSNHHQENAELNKSEEMMIGLLGSWLVQEKLYAAEKCMVPLKFVQELSDDQSVLKLKPHVLKEVKELNQ
ncbi:hypothetical protein CASFOL_024578 [Castilleja foliolosa]|uniref:BHLH domain-containing protein n=1 Tax=Castilleja foliolosa TaxID=1961234 RepID=A0ABD3CR37_9LAMI